MELFIANKSIIHSWDSRIKILTFFLFILGIASLKSFVGLFFVLLISVFSLFLSKTNLNNLLKILKAPLFFLAFTFIILGLSSGGKIIYNIGPINIYYNGLILSAVISLRAISIIFIFATLFGSTRFSEIFNALNSFHIPSIFVCILLFTWRYIFLYLESISKLFSAAKLKGYSKIKGLIHIKTTTNLLTTLLINSFEQSERVKASMVCRGFNGTISFKENHKLKPIDFFISVLYLFSITTIIIFELWK